MTGHRSWFGCAAIAIVVAAAAVACSSGHTASSSTPTTPATSAQTVANSDAPVGSISHVGRWLVDRAGRVVFLHGVNMVAKESPYYPAANGFGSDDAAWISSHGFNVVRLGVMATGLMPQPGQIDTTYLDHLAQTVDLLGRDHVLVLLDFHQDGWGPEVGSDGFPAWMTLTGTAKNTHTPFPLYYVTNPAIQQSFQSFWNNAPGPGGTSLQDQFAAMIRALGQRFADDPAVLGYDVFNEPWPGTTWSKCLNDANGCPTLDHGELDPFYARVNRALRTVDKTHLLFVEPFVLFNYGESKTNVSLAGSQSGLSFHLYAIDQAHEPKVLDNAEAWSQSTGGALLNTEWGATTDPATIERQAGELDDAMIPWIFWSYDQIAADNMTQAPGTGTFSNTGAAALVSPHPSVVAGTPTHLSYDPASRSMSFSWSTTRPGGTSSPGYPAGTVTAIETPASVYPHGFVVAATGATVTSKPCAPIVTLTTRAGASNATVRISPGTGCA